MLLCAVYLWPRVGLAYVFGVPIGGRRLIEGQYYWVYGTFLARLILRCRQRHRTQRAIYDIVRPPGGVASAGGFTHVAWRSVSGGLGPTFTPVWLGCLMLEIAAASGARAVLVGWSFIS